jgi:hypothetical protein
LVFDAAIHEPRVAPTAPENYGCGSLRSAGPKLGYFHVGAETTIETERVKSMVALANGTATHNVPYAGVPERVPAVASNGTIGNGVEPDIAIHHENILAVCKSDVLKSYPINKRIRRTPAIYLDTPEQTITTRIDRGDIAIDIFVCHPIARRHHV